MCWDISLHTGLEFVKKVFTKLRDERKQLDFNYRYFENVLIITFCAYSIIYKYKEGEEIGLLEMEWGVLPSYLKHATEQETVAAK
ncbi:hypothetical protein [Sphingobacterium kitahiroshimense]|uniref:Transposase n=1 Tax=Sphingobacterium kitahiroshimense TaxID=470446 RepID=A0ABV0BZB5_9SPHI